MEIAVLALGCFWGPEIKFSKIEGIIKTEVGYCGGNSPTQLIKKFVQETLIMLKLLNLILMKKL
jgi:peptide methionine sulfoxide reductase MsrA